MVVRSKAPLRLGLAGGGTDLSPYCDEYGGYVLNATISLYAYCTIEPLDNGRVIFEAVDRGERFESQAEAAFSLDDSLSLHKGVYNRIIKEFNNNIPLSFKMTTYSDAPAGSGLGSSSTMVVSIIKAFVEWLSLPLGEYDIARLAFEIEREEVGIIGGAQDQYAATFGGFNFMEFYSDKRVIVNPLRIKNWIIDELESSFILYFTDITRNASIIEEEKKNAIEKNQIALDAMQSIKYDAIMMKEALLKGDIIKLAKILENTWESKKRMASSISNYEINMLFDLAIKNGAYSGKLSGAGGGGFMFFIVDPTKKLQLVHILNNQRGKVINFHFVKDGSRGWRV
ncbi:dehydrogenase [Dehalobacter sp. CF]|jgi:Predicted kinase related to galactokinase and mevalonate kinase|uniref:GHMP family kinase ATP-binding protein n=1 Tax=Dehalobacter sp. CF TaxID=1131462 RepID=UPI00028BBE7E|nr:dehydrogenase [Dehalobacter sp. CF]AFV05143.1 D,D-heptose 7-phosphate kinase [Dehalobacter sp. CF]